MAVRKDMQDKQAAREKKALELQRDFSFDGYQVVRRELFAHLRDPAIIIRPDSISFNAACIGGLENVLYVNVMINPEKKHMICESCDENTKDSVRWCCIDKNGKRKSRKIVSRMLCNMLYELMGWDYRCRYKILGYNIKVYDKPIFIFDLSDTEIFIENKKQVQTDLEKAGIPENEINALVQTKGMPKAYYPAEWKKSFGLPLPEHKNALKVDDLDEFKSAEDVVPSLFSDEE